VDQESKFDFFLRIVQVIAFLSQLFYMRSVSSSNPSLLDVHYKRNLKIFSTFCPNVSTKVLGSFDLGTLKANLNNKVRLSYYIIQHVDICFWKIIFKLPYKHSVFFDGLIMAICSTGNHRPHTFAVQQRQLLRHI